MAQSPRSEAAPAAAPPVSVWGESAFILYVLLGLLMVVCLALFLPPIRAGDGHEYLLMTQALSAHGSPDIRPADVDEHIELLRRNGLVWEGEAVTREPFLRTSFTAADGQVHFGHFWLYSLLAVPAWRLLRLAGGNEMAALQAMNAVCFCLAAGLVLFHGRDTRRDRWLLLAFSAVGPVIWFIRWPHPEVFTWSAALIAVAMLRRDRFGWAALAASLGATQNPPLALLALLAVALAAGRRNWRAAALAAAGAALSLLPALYCLARFGMPNLILARGGADFALVSIGRVWSVLADLNQGMLPYVPLVLLLGLLGGGAALARGRARGILVLAALLGMILLVCPQRNWNSGTAGMIRYAVWMVPLLAWLAVDFAPRGRAMRWIVGAGLLLQAGIVLGHNGREDYLRQSALARFVLTRCPKLYSPDPQIFADRQLGREVEYWKGQLPIPFVTASGWVTKILVDRQAHRELSDYFIIDPAAGWPGEPDAGSPRELYYLNPPRRALRVTEPEGTDPAVFRQQLRIRLFDLPERIAEPAFEITAEVANQGPFAYWGERACVPTPLKLGYVVRREGEVVRKGRAAMPFVLKPQAVTVRKMRIELPDAPGRYRLTVGTLLETLAWSESTASLTVDCVQSELGQYRGTVVIDPAEEGGPHVEKLDAAKENR